ncbi:CoA pyrophosphatase [Terrarubrum flagellatum]|uniref:CoA pyrophosphatase n=1 Tax=Terrirubrum flagellatum TaxID=2895980 RepID=UPI0031456ADA
MTLLPADATAPIDDFIRRARERLLPEPPALTGADDPLGAAGDHVLNPGYLPPEFGRTARAAAVLIPVVAHDSEATVLLTERASGLRDHSGQIAFPGGKIDAADDGPLGAALREAEEEIGLQREFVSLLGYLPPYLTGSGFRIAPVVALARPGFTLTLNHNEVGDAFETPLSFLMDVANHERGMREWNGMKRYFYRMPHDGRNIWGVTAGIIRQLRDRIYGP